MGYAIGPTLAVGGEKEYTAAMKRVKESMTYVKAEAAAAISVFSKNEKSVDSLTAQINNSKKALDVQKQAVKAAEDALKRMADSGVDPTSTAYQRMEANLNNAKAAMNGTQTEINEQEKELKECTTALNTMSGAEKNMGAQAKNAGKDIKNAESQTKSFKSQIKEFASSSVGQFASIAGAVALATKAVQALGDIIDDATNWADDLGTLSNQTGIATSTLQKFGYAARFIDTETDDMQKGLAKVVKAIGSAQSSGQNYIDITDGISVSIVDANGKLKDSEQAFYDVIDALGSLGDETKRETASQEIFGKSYQDMMPLIKAGSSALKKYGDQAKDTGVVIDDTTVAVLQKLDDKLEETTAIADAQGRKFAASLASTTDTIATAWTKIKGYFFDQISIEDDLVKAYQVREGYSKDAAEAEVKRAEAIANLAYIMDTNAQDAQKRVEEYSDYLISVGVPATESYDTAISNLANGIDEAKYATEQMQQAQSNADDAINQAAADYAETYAQYMQAVQKTAESYASDLGGLFDKFDAGLAKNKDSLNAQSQELLDNLKSQVDGFDGWATEIEKLSKRGIDDGLLQKLRDMGPEAYAKIQALNNMTDDQLKDYVGLYRKMGQDINKEAATANDDLRKKTVMALETARVEANNKVVAMEALGVRLGQGVGNGMESTSSYMAKKLQAAINDAVSAAKTKYGIHSPSVVMAKLLGGPMGQGVGVGWVEGLKSSIPSVTDQMMAIANSVKGAIPASVSAVSGGGRGGTVVNMNNTFGGTYKERDGAAVARSLNRQLGRLYA